MTANYGILDNYNYNKINVIHHMVTQFRIIDILENRQIIVTPEAINLINLLLAKREKVNNLNIRLSELIRDKEEALEYYNLFGLEEMHYKT
jgi:hypothetical protein